MCIYFLPLSTEKSKNKDQIVTFEQHFPVKDTSAPGRNGRFQQTGMANMNLEHENLFHVQSLNGQMWNNLSIDKDNTGNGLKGIHIV